MSRSIATIANPPPNIHQSPNEGNMIRELFIFTALTGNAEVRVVRVKVALTGALLARFTEAGITEQVTPAMTGSEQLKATVLLILDSGATAKTALACCPDDIVSDVGVGFIEKSGAVTFMKSKEEADW